MKQRLASCRILLVDRRASSRAGLTGILTRLGIPAAHLLHAEHGRSALQLLAEQPVDLVISAIDFAPPNGLALLEQIRHGLCAAPANLPFVFVTADGSPEHRLLAARLGVDGIISKPPHPVHVERSVIRLLATRRAAQPACCQLVRLPDELPAGLSLTRPVLAMTPGQLLTADLRSHSGTLLLPRGSILTSAVISVLLQYRRHFGAETMTVLRATHAETPSPVPSGMP
ncbi:MAG: response regulator [Laribacter sp.]|nr:response regulator [Laribacter sp.]MBP9527850.1 response regulator [Laribacter sp.]MBP9609953.1 response regulator [Laribacter sp.]